MMSRIVASICCFGATLGKNLGRFVVDLIAESNRDQYNGAGSLCESSAAVWTPVPLWLIPPIVACAWTIGYALALANEARKRQAFAATLTKAERAQFNAYRAVLPWRNFANVVASDRSQVAAVLGGLSSISSLSDHVRALRRHHIAARGGQVHRARQPR
jgi:hypothetical protein